MFWIILVPNPIKEFCTQHTEGVWDIGQQLGVLKKNWFLFKRKVTSTDLFVRPYVRPLQRPAH